MSTKHPWDTDMKELESSKLEANQKLRMLGFFSIKPPDSSDIGDKIKVHNVFHVIENGDKAEFRIAIGHEDHEGVCEGHASVVAEYPIEDIEDLVEEAIEFCKFSFDQIVELAGKGFPLAPINGKAVMITGFNKGMPSNAMGLAALRQATIKTLGAGKEGDIGLAESILGITQASLPQEKPKFGFVAEPAHEANDARLAKAAQESTLINMYGKSKMNKLAKQIGYKGELINKHGKSKTRKSSEGRKARAR